MKRLTISADACTETLALLITMAWADGRLDDKEKEGVRAAASVFNLSKELRDRLDQLLQKPMPVDELLVENLNPRDRAFAFVAASWMAGVDDDVDPKEEAIMDQAAQLLGFSATRKSELQAISRDLAKKKERSWSQEIVALFRAIPSRLEGDGSETFEVAFE
jgi:uncharacterized membrane protein YebE (DUF533 family)